MEIQIGGQTFKENCHLKINEEDFNLRFINVGPGRFTIELQSVKNPKKFDIIGEFKNGKAVVNDILFHAELISDDESPQPNR